MFCGFCGKKISSKERVCPYCGQTQEARKGGNGFWDLFSPQSEMDRAGQETVNQPSEPPVEPLNSRKQPMERRPRNPKKGKGLSLIILALLIVSILFEILTFFSIHNQRKALQDMQKNFDTQQKTLDKLEQENQHISGYLGDVTAMLTEIASTEPDAIDENATEMSQETVPEEPSVSLETATQPTEEPVEMVENGRNENEILPESGKSNELS